MLETWLEFLTRTGDRYQYRTSQSPPRYDGAEFSCSLSILIKFVLEEIGSNDFLELKLLFFFFVFQLECKFHFD